MKRTKLKPTKREYEVLNHLADGKIIKEISDTLSILLPENKYVRFFGN